MRFRLLGTPIYFVLTASFLTFCLLCNAPFPQPIPIRANATASTHLSLSSPLFTRRRYELSGAHAKACLHPPGYYASLLTVAPAPDAAYAISKDLERTFPGESSFSPNCVPLPFPPTAVSPLTSPQFSSMSIFASFL